jgi:hypothetical protein
MSGWKDRVCKICPPVMGQAHSESGQVDEVQSRRAFLCRSIIATEFSLSSALPALVAAEMSQGPIGLTFDDSTGRLTRITYKGDVIAEPPREANPVSFAIGPADRPQWVEDLNLARKLVKTFACLSG